MSSVNVKAAPKIENLLEFTELLYGLVSIKFFLSKPANFVYVYC